MVTRKSGLGRGLGALMAEMASAAEEPEANIRLLPLEAIERNGSQPRRHFDAEALEELAASIRQKGVLQPILVRPAASGRYEIVAGERRWRASRMAGLAAIPAVVRAFSDADGFEAALVENVQRADLDPLEEARGYQRLIAEYGHTQEMVAAMTGKARSHIANLLRLLDLPEEVQEMLHQGLIRVGHAKAVLQAKDPLALAREIVRRGLSVRSAEEAARKSQREGQRESAGRPGAGKGAAGAGAGDADLLQLEEQLSTALGLAVAIRAKSTGGTLSIDYADLDQLDRLVGLLQQG